MDISSIPSLPISTPPSSLGDCYTEVEVQKMLATQEKIGKLIYASEPQMRQTLVTEEARARRDIEQAPRREARRLQHEQTMDAIRRRETPILRSLDVVKEYVIALKEENAALKRGEDRPVYTLGDVALLLFSFISGEE